MLSPVETHPMDVFLDGFDILHVLFFRVGVVQAQVAAPPVLKRYAEIDAEGLGMPNVQVTVGLGRKTRHHPAAVFPGPNVLLHPLADKILALFLSCFFHNPLSALSPNVVLIYSRPVRYSKVYQRYPPKIKRN